MGKASGVSRLAGSQQDLFLRKQHSCDFLSILSKIKTLLEMEMLSLQDYENHGFPKFHYFSEAAHDLFVGKGICVGEQGNGKKYDNWK